MIDQIDRLLNLAAAIGLPGVVRSLSYGTPSVKVGTKFLARLTDATTLAIKCPMEEKALLIAAEPDFYFETNHYRGHDALLVRLDVIDDARLSARLERAWKMQTLKRSKTSKAGSAALRSA